MKLEPEAPFCYNLEPQRRTRNSRDGVGPEAQPYFDGLGHRCATGSSASCHCERCKSAAHGSVREFPFAAKRNDDLLAVVRDSEADPRAATTS